MAMRKEPSPLFKKSALSGEKVEKSEKTTKFDKTSKFEKAKKLLKASPMPDLEPQPEPPAADDAEPTDPADISSDIDAAFADMDPPAAVPVLEREAEEAPAAAAPSDQYELQVQSDPHSQSSRFGGGDVSGEVEDIFASFESKIDEEVEEHAAKRTKSRPADRKIEQVVAQLVRTLTSKREVTAKDLEVVLEVTKNKIVEAVNAQAITIFFVEDDGIHFRHISYSRSLYKGDAQSETRFEKAIERLKKTVLPPGSGIVGRVINENKTNSTLDAQRDPAYNDEILRMTGFPVRTMITVPISYDKQVYGAIQCMNKNPASGEEFFSSKDIRLVEEVADYSARIIFMARNPGFAWGEEDVARYVARVAKLEYVDVREFEVEPHLLQVVGEDTLRKFQILPLKKVGSKTIKAAIDNPLDIHRREAFEMSTDLHIEVLVVSPAKQIVQAIDKVFKKHESDNISAAFKAELAEKARADVEKIDLSEDADKNSAPVIRLANQIIEDAFARGASDIHIEPFEKEVIVRYRADGVLEEKMRLPAAAIRPLTARLKIMAGLNIAENRLPQDGRIMFKEHTKTNLDIDLRVACAPMMFGEKTVMRILDKRTTAVSLDKMGYSKHNMDLYEKCLAAPFGMILHCGPTGSGKTTTLYAAVNYLNTPDMNIQTAEDPVEFMIAGINQMQMKPQIGLNFAKALKCYLRQDPDIILIGEIRYLEVAEIAIEAALTGHQVLSTLHTNDAAGTITRFVEMGIEPYLLTGSILCICAQRLMRRACSNCREQVEPSEAERVLLGLQEGEEATIYKAVKSDCQKCSGSGYKGRVGTHELMVMNAALREVCGRPHATSAEIDKVAREKGEMIPLFDDAMDKVKQGITTIDEALRTVRVEKS